MWAGATELRSDYECTVCEIAHVEPNHIAAVSHYVDTKVLIKVIELSKIHAKLKSCKEWS